LEDDYNSNLTATQLGITSSNKNYIKHTLSLRVNWTNLKSDQQFLWKEKIKILPFWVFILRLADEIIFKFVKKSRLINLW
jgi:hypothetical protein